MKRRKANFKNNQEIIAGEIKTVAGKITGNEQLELRGKIQSSKASFRKRTNLGNMVYEVKEAFAAKLNDMADKK